MIVKDGIHDEQTGNHGSGREGFASTEDATDGAIRLALKQ